MTRLLKLVIISGLFLQLVQTGFAYDRTENYDLQPNITDPARWTLGLEAAKIYDLKMRTSDQFDFAYAQVKDMNQVSVLPAYKIFQNEVLAASIHGRLGASNMKLESRDTAENKLEIDYDWGFLWGFGGDVNYNVDPETIITLQSDYKHSDPSIRNQQFGGEDSLQGSNLSKNRAHVRQFETALLLRRIFDLRQQGDLKLVPYAGPVLNFTSVYQGDISFETLNFSIANVSPGGAGKDHVGLIVGLDLLSITETIKLKIEAQLFSQTSILASFHWNF